MLFQVGIAEANMMYVAAGMTIGGKIFHWDFANFDGTRTTKSVVLLPTREERQNLRTRGIDLG